MSVVSIEDYDLDGKVDWFKVVSLHDGALLEDTAIPESERNRLQKLFNGAIEGAYKRNLEGLLQGGQRL
jgi:hypothetical protein